MKAVLILFVGFIFSGMPLMVAYAEENQALSDPAVSDEGVSKQAVSEQVAAKETPAEREVYAKSLFEGRCQMCHQLPEPGMLRPKQWQFVLTVMQQRMQQAGVPPLTEDETERLLEYFEPRAR